MRKKKKVIIYLDQFASSNLAAATKEGLWFEIRTQIENLTNRGVICCPLSPEHYVETSGRDYQRANEQTDFFRKISGNLIFNILEKIISNEIVNVIRVRENKIIRSYYLTKLINAMLFEDVNQHGKLYLHKNVYNDYIKEKYDFVNDLRKKSKQFDCNVQNH